MFRLWVAIPLWQRVFVALILGILLGIVWPAAGIAIDWVGELFIRLIRMLIIPLVFTTLIAGIVSLSDIRKLGTIGLLTLGVYLLTTLIAIAIGVALATLFEPGVGVDLGGSEPLVLQSAMTLEERLLGIVPTNPVAAMAEGDVLPVIFFALIFGVGLLMAGEKGELAGKVFQSLADGVLQITHIIMEVAPFGVLALIATAVAERGLASLASILELAALVYVGCLLHIFVVQAGLVRLLAGLSAVKFMKGVIDAQLVAFSSALSSATLPVSMTVARENLGIKPSVVGSVLPLGVTVNMDGTALYVGILSVFGAQAFGVDLGFTEYLLITLTTTLVSVGAASVPSAVLFLIATVYSGIGMSAEQTAIIVGFILPFDRFLDMIRTAVNVTGDLAAATIVARRTGEIDLAVYEAEPER
jgi:Na+/H+-dicarboxylate symporter